MNPDELGREAELDRIIAMLERDRFDHTVADEVIKYFEKDFSEIKDELTDISDSLDKKIKPNRYVDYKSGWYQDLKGNLYKYDGVVWDNVPGLETGELEFLG